MSAGLSSTDIVRGAAAAACNPWELHAIAPDGHPARKLLEAFHERQMLLMRDFWANHFSKLNHDDIVKLYAELPEFVRTTIEIYAGEPDEEKAYEREKDAWAMYRKKISAEADIAGDIDDTSGEIDEVPPGVVDEIPPELGSVFGVVAGTEYIGELTIDGKRLAGK